MKILLVRARVLCKRTDGHAWKCINVTAVFFRGVNTHADIVKNLGLKQGCVKAGLPPQQHLQNCRELRTNSSHYVLQLCLTHADIVENLGLKQGCIKAGLPPQQHLQNSRELLTNSSHYVLLLCLLRSHWCYDMMSCNFFFFMFTGPCIVIRIE